MQREVLGITIYSHRDLEKLLKGSNRAYNRRRQRVLKGQSPDEVVRSRLAAEPKLANRRFKPPDSHASPQALRVIVAAKRYRIQTPEVEREVLSHLLIYVNMYDGQLQPPRRIFTELDQSFPNSSTRRPRLHRDIF